MLAFFFSRRCIVFEHTFDETPGGTIFWYRSDLSEVQVRLPSLAARPQTFTKVQHDRVTLMVGSPTGVPVDFAVLQGTVTKPEGLVALQTEVGTVVLVQRSDVVHFVRAMQELQKVFRTDHGLDAWERKWLPRRVEERARRASAATST
jgi:hypothetical protein